MWPRRIPKEEGCRELGKVLREALETSEAERYEDFLASAEPSVREHVMICEGCRAELSDALLVRRLLRGNVPAAAGTFPRRDRKSTRLNSSHGYISYAVFCLKKKKEIVAKPAEAAPNHTLVE